MTEADLLSDIDPVLRRRDPNVSEATFATRVYLAGPMRGIAEFNFPAFDMAAAQLRGAGYEVWSPAEHDRAHGFDSTEMTGHENLAEYGFSLRDALTRDMAEVAKSDAICLLDGWERSKGAKAEHALAEALWIQTGTLEEYLPVEPMSEHEYLTGGAFPPIVEVDMAKCTVDEIGWRLGCAPPDEIRVTSSTGGQKGQKLAQANLFPVGPLRTVAELYGVGAKKYAPRNWELGYAWSLPYDSIHRHLWSFWSGENDDAETGLPHLAAVVFHALSLMEYRTTHPEFDDRPGQ